MTIGVTLDTGPVQTPIFTAESAHWRGPFRITGGLTGSRRKQTFTALSFLSPTFICVRRQRHRLVVVHGL